MYNLAVFKTAAAADVPLLDITSCFLSRPNYADYLCEDGIHPNSEGYRLIANALYEQMKI